MRLRGTYVIDKSGALFWLEAFCIESAALKEAYQHDPMVAFTCENYAHMGVMVGSA
ncbi:MAG TPA: hypothetical protein VHA06_17885 [Candidatus Angelobacter sp.]|jgi:hypothetical protein|nr:hypothetical protein [Candidatus Angelobacter sp.]